MATYYLDFENGNDANTGADWANAWKTLNNGATAARIAPGDEIRIAKSADPTSIGNATWTNKSATVTLATAQTTNIYLDGAWTAANSGTATTTGTRKEGSNASSITTAATTATSTKYAYLTVGGASGLDLSSYDAITFWIQNAGVAVVANNYQIKLCSDTTGDTAVDTFDIPAIQSTGNWVPLTLTRSGGGNLGSAIKSIAWYTGTVSPGNSRNIFIDDILGCSNSGLNLTSLISKNSSAYTNPETADTWHGLQSINNTTVILANLNTENTGSGSIRGYFTTGTSPSTVTTYVRPTIKFPMRTGNTAEQPIQDSGDSSNQIKFSGGWNTTNTTQDGDTWIDGQNGLGYAIDLNGKQYLTFERLNTVRFRTGLFASTANLLRINVSMICVCCNIAANTGFNDSTLTITVNNCSQSYQETPTTNNTSVYSLRALNNSQSAIIPGGTYTNLVYNYNNNVLEINSSATINYFEMLDNGNGSATNVNFISGNHSILEAVIRNNTATNTIFSSSVSILNINKLTASGNSNIGSFTGLLTVRQTNAASSQLLGNGASPQVPRQAQYPSLQYNAINNVITDNRVYWRYGNALSQTTTRKSATGIAWQINITDTLQTTNRPFYFPIAKIACNASSLVTVKAWVKLSHATDIGAKLLIQNGEIAGVSANVTATKAADTNWEELTITFTPTVAGVAQIYVQGYWLANLADESIYVDDITVTQA